MITYGFLTAQTSQACHHKQNKAMGVEEAKPFVLFYSRWKELDKKCSLNIETVMLQSNDLLNVTVPITDQNRCHVWLSRGRKAHLHGP